MAYPGVAAFIIGVTIAAVLYYMFSSQDVEHGQTTHHEGQQRESSRNASTSRSETPGNPYRPLNNRNVSSDNNYRNRRRGSNRIENPEECTICLNTITDGKRLMQNCKHVFHETCIREWETIEKSCPNCRRRYK